MTTRATQKDTAADLELYGCLTSAPPRSFLMVAGAGSGKTTSLIKGLTKVLKEHGENLKLRRQRVACITYTDIAAGEIWADVGNNPLVNVSTIHSFLWSIAKPFQTDIAHWVSGRIDEKIADLRRDSERPRIQKRTLEKNAADIRRLEQQRQKIERVRSFTYGTGSDYANGILGHDDVIKLASHLITDRPLMRTLLSQQYPFLFVDESQDTMEGVVLALKAVADEGDGKFCLGFFGDPMQQIYATGIGPIPKGDTWAEIAKPENFRCSAAVLRVANAIRRDGDGLVQTRGRMEGPADAQVSVPGSANLFILPSDDRRDQHLAKIRSWVANKTGDRAWDNNGDVKVLVIVHRMAANRLGFGDLYSAMNNKAPEKFKNGFLDGTAWPIRPFTNFILPLVSAVSDDNEFEAMQILRSDSPLLHPERLTKTNVAERLATLRQFTLDLHAMLAIGSVSTVADVLTHVHNSKVIDLDERLVSYLRLPAPEETAKANVGEVPEDEPREETEKELAAMDAFLACRASQFWGYYRYVNDQSPFSTHQGIKGAEFDRVLVILDDDEGTHVQFSYEKYFGIKELSERDEENLREGKDSTVDRTRRLFYVCCTRALKDLTVALFTANVELAREKVLALGLFDPEMIHLQSDLEDRDQGAQPL